MKAKEDGYAKSTKQVDLSAKSRDQGLKGRTMENNSLKNISS